MSDHEKLIAERRVKGYQQAFDAIFGSNAAPIIIRKKCRCCDVLALPGEELCGWHTWENVRGERNREGAR